MNKEYNSSEYHSSGQNTMVKDAAILLVITLFSGLILGLVYQITKEPIALAEERAAKEAYSEVFPAASEYELLEDLALELLSEDTEWLEAGFDGVSIENVLKALDNDGSLLGYVLTVTSHEGYGGDITFTMGIANDGTLNGISILDISETAGLGMKAEEVLKPQFADKNVSGFTYTKTGAVSDDQIDAISGATITTKAVTKAVNSGLYYFQTQLGGGSDEAKERGGAVSEWSRKGKSDLCPDAGHVSYTGCDDFSDQRAWHGSYYYGCTCPQQYVYFSFTQNNP